MNKFPLVEMIAFFSQYLQDQKPVWREPYVKHTARIRSCHSKMDGGVRKSFFSVETKMGSIFDLVFDEEELLWSLDARSNMAHYTVDRVLALIQRHKHLPSRAHRIIPYRFEIIPRAQVQRKQSGMELSLVQRVQPYRFQSGKIISAQVIKIPTKHLENVMITKQLHYVVETDAQRFFHLVYILDEMDWRMIQEVDEEFFFVR